MGRKAQSVTKKQRKEIEKLKDLLKAMDEEDLEEEDGGNLSEDELLGELEEDDDIQGIADAYIEPKTKENYQRCQVRFLLFLLTDEKLSDLLVNESLRTDLVGIDDLQQQRKTIFSHLDHCSKNYQPVNLARLQPSHFIKYLLSLSDTKNDDYLKAYGTHRSALADLFTRSEVIQSELFKTSLAKLFKGLKKKSAKARGTKGMPLGEGKEPLPFELYRAICTWLLEDGSSEAIFAHAFLTTTWNLMCRSVNTVYIRREHVSWVGDSMVMQFPTTKKDKLGRLAGQKRHIYANPDMPEICNVTSIARYLLAFPDGHEGALFPGQSQYDRFRQFLRRLLDKRADEVRRFGVEPEDIGVHSIRKGAATYCCSGTTAAVSLSAVCNRAGWDMGGSKKVYLRWEAAGDQHCGRTVSGLDVCTARFALSPPFFCPSVDLEANEDESMDEMSVTPFEPSEDNDGEEAQIDNAIQTAFPNTPQRWALLCRFLLASLLYHRPFLEETARKSRLKCESDGSSTKSNNDRFLQNVIFRRGLFDDVAEYVKVCLPFNNPLSTVWRITFTGIPPVVSNFIYSEKILHRMKVQGKKTVSGVKDLLDSRALGGGELTLKLLRSELVAPIEERLNRIDVLTARHGHGLEASAKPEGPTFRTVPVNYKLNTKMGPLEAWTCWHLGEEVTALGNIPRTTPPWHSLKPSDLLSGSSTQRGYLRNLKTLCNCLDLAAGLTVYSKPSAEQIVKLYADEAVKGVLPETTPKGRERRNAQLTWEYAGRVLNRKETANNAESTTPTAKSKKRSKPVSNSEDAKITKVVRLDDEKATGQRKKKKMKIEEGEVDEETGLRRDGKRIIYRIPGPVPTQPEVGRKSLEERDVYPLMEQGRLLTGFCTSGYFNILARQHHAASVRRTDDFFYPTLQTFCGSEDLRRRRGFNEYLHLEEHACDWDNDLILAQVFRGNPEYGHWALLVIDNKARSVILFDSSPSFAPDSRKIFERFFRRCIYPNITGATR